MIVCVLCIHFIFGRTFQLHQNQRQSVDEQDNVGATVVAILDVCKLVNHIETVVRNDLVVDQVYNGIAFLALDKVSDRNAVLQIVHELHVLLQQTACVKIAELADCFIDCVQRQPLIQFHKAVHENSIQQRAGIIPLHVWGVDVGVTHVLEQFYDCLLEHILCEMHNDASFGRYPAGDSCIW